jgi:OmpA-OmpF porin, OOP family
MRLFNATKLCQALCFTTLSLSVSANEQPTAESLVGNNYLGGHVTYIKTDLDRLFTLDSKSAIDGAAGFGGEFGYRISPFYEARLSLTKLNIDTGHKGYDVPSGSSTALDLLYFPHKANFYFVAGADFLDIGNSILSAD